MRCQPVHDACLTLNEPQPTCSSDCKHRPFRLVVHSAHAQKEVQHALARLKHVKDPINSHVMRHLERDIFAEPSTTPSRPIVPGSSFTMLWPAWEGGFGDLVMWTILPIGYALYEDSLPNGTLGISGALYTRAWHPVLRARSVCTFERDEWYEVPDGANTIRERVHNPLPRCSRVACYETVHLCEPMHGGVTGVESWTAQRELDSLLGFPRLQLASSAISSSSAPTNWPATPSMSAPMSSGANELGETRSRTLRVVFARRMSWHGRSLVNAANITRECSNMLLRGGAKGGGGGRVTWRLSCQLLSLGSLPIKRAVSILREADVLISMHGADAINGLHLPPGRAVVEIVNHNFDRSADFAPFWFVSCFNRHLSAVYQHKRIVLAPVLRGEQSPQRAWNLNATLSSALLEQVLSSIIARDGQARFLEQPEHASLRPDQAVQRHHDAAAALPAADADAVDGYCSFTDENEGDCDAGSKGSFAIGGPRLPLTAAWCTAACATCPRCRAVSFSTIHKDCSWFHSCDLAKLKRNPSGFRSWRVRKSQKAVARTG